jgi:hypothetical protein
MSRYTPRRATIALPPPAELADDELLASFERALGIRSYSAVETMAIVGTGGNGLLELERTRELVTHRNGTKERAYPGPVIAQYLWRRQKQALSAPSHQEQPRKPREQSSATGRRGRPPKGNLRSVSEGTRR